MPFLISGPELSAIGGETGKNVEYHLLLIAPNGMVASSRHATLDDARKAMLDSLEDASRNRMSVYIVELQKGGIISPFGTGPYRIAGGPNAGRLLVWTGSTWNIQDTAPVTPLPASMSPYQVAHEKAVAEGPRKEAAAKFELAFYKWAPFIGIGVVAAVGIGIAVSAGRRKR